LLSPRPITVRQTPLVAMESPSLTSPKSSVGAWTVSAMSSPWRRSAARVPTASIIPVNMQITLMMTGPVRPPITIGKSGYPGGDADILSHQPHILDAELGRLEKTGERWQMEQATPLIPHQFRRLIKHQLIHQPLVQQGTAKPGPGFHQ